MPEKKKEVKLKVPKNASLARFFLRPLGKILVASCMLLAIAGGGVFTYYYAKYSRLIDQKLKAGPFANTSKIFAAPETVAVGDAISPDEIIADLRRSGYSSSRSNPMGYFQQGGDSLEIFPGPESYFDQEAGVIKFAAGRISQIISLRDNTQRSQYQLEPQLITNLSDRKREKRRLVQFGDIPKILVDAVTSAEDKRFFQHAGFDPIRILMAAYVDLKERRKEQGASTLTQQLARSLWLEPQKRWTRKIAELLITVQLEQKLSKEQIFEDYANQVYLGRRGSFSIHGFGEAAEAYFGKDIRQLTLPEAATLAGMIQRPGYFNPFLHPKRVIERRNLVLNLMRQNGHITDREYGQAMTAPLSLAKGESQSIEAPYFVDLVNDTLQSRFQDYDFQDHSFRIYTTLDLNLQRAAVNAVRNGMQLVDERLRKQRRFRKEPMPTPQVALIALDPHTGAIKALVGGRNYGMSQLNHVLAMRQPGSIFKPFVYAVALDSAIDGAPRILTAGTTVDDEPTTFWFNGKPYSPDNFLHEFHGVVTLRQALAKSMNVATVKLAQMVGYDKVVDLAKEAGLNDDIEPTPAIALGSYDVTPLEMAGAYTIYANDGVYVKPSYISMVRSENGNVIYTNKMETHRVLDPRVSFLMTSLMEEVLRSGTAVGVRARGFTAPAAGKTGTSHDGWFAGYTSRLLCIVWVGFDDNRELNLEGAHSALPIWTDLMKSSLQLRDYRNVQPFEAPDGIVAVQIDPLSGMPATPLCPETRVEFYIAGTQPVGTCPLHGGHGVTNVAGWGTAPPTPVIEPLPPRPSGTPAVAARKVTPVASTADPPGETQQAAKPKQEKKKGFFHRLWGVFK